MGFLPERLEGRKGFVETRVLYYVLRSYTLLLMLGGGMESVAEVSRAHTPLDPWGSEHQIGAAFVPLVPRSKFQATEEENRVIGENDSAKARAASVPEIVSTLRTSVPWLCRGRAPYTATNLHEAAASKLRALRDSKPQTEQGATLLALQRAEDAQAEADLRRALDSGRIEALGTGAIHYRLSPIGDRALQLTVGALRAHGEFLPAALFLKGYFKDNAQSLCTHQSARKLVPSAIEIYKKVGFLEESSFLKRLLGKCTDLLATEQLLLKDPSTRESIAPFLDQWASYFSSQPNNKRLPEISLMQSLAYGASAEEARELFGTDASGVCLHVGGPWSLLPILIEDPASLKYAERRMYNLIPTALETLANGSEPMRAGVAENLSSLGPESPEVFEALAKALSDPAALVRERAARALRLSGPAAESAVPALIGAMKDPEEAVRNQALESLSNILWLIGTKRVAFLPDLLKLLEYSDPKTRLGALVLLDNAWWDASVVIPHYIKALSDEDNSVVVRAVIALGNCGESAFAAVVPLTALLNETENPDRLYLIVRALGQIGEKAASAVESLQKLLTHENQGVRSSVVGAFGNLGEGAQTVVPDLLRVAARDKSEVVRNASVSTLARLGRQFPSVMLLLSNALAGESAEIRKQAAISIGAIGEDAQAAIPALMNTLGDVDKEVRGAAARALGQIGEKAHVAIPALTQLLADKEYVVQFKTVEALGAIGEKAHPAAPVLIKILLDNRSFALPEKTEQALVSIGKSSIPALKIALADPLYEPQHPILKRILEKIESL